MTVRRNRVLWVGSRTGWPNANEYINRDLELIGLQQNEPTVDDLTTARAIVYHYGDGKLAAVSKVAEKSVRLAIEHGLSVFAIGETDAIIKQVQLDLSAYPGVIYRVGVPKQVHDHEIAQRTFTATPKRAWSDKLAIKKANAFKLDAEGQFFLRRAFSDCKEVRLTKLGGGNTAQAFMVEATLKPDSRVGPRPLPFFAKLGKSNKIAQEEERYATFATNYIPFYLRPNLDPSRCLIGHAKGVLVGNLVAPAVPLWSAVEAGRETSILLNLFKDTLGGWRLQAFECAPISGEGVAGAMRDFFQPERVQPPLITAAKAIGLEDAPRTTWLHLLGATKSCFYRGAIHGDLHPENVFVRNEDAILIDLCTVQQGPISADPACLEVSFMLERREADDDSAGDDIPFEEWRSLVDDFFAPETFAPLGGLAAAPSTAPSNVFWARRWDYAAVVRQIGLKHQACDEDYLTAVAVYLLRRAMYPGKDETDKQRRAYALVLAERLVKHLMGVN